MASLRQAVDPDYSSDGSERGWTFFLVGFGGAIGTLLRFGVESAVSPAANGWPMATFLINISGAFILAVLLESLSLHGPDDGWRRRIRLGVGTGMLGGFTTYSSFVVETALLGADGRHLVAFGYAATSVLLGLLAAWAGIVFVGAVRRGSRAEQ